MNNRIKINLGNVPIILVASHAGNYKPKDIPDISSSEVKKVLPDLFTDKLIQETIEALSLYDIKPSTVVMGISRGKVDLNKRPEYAYIAASRGKEVYENFHNTLTSITESNKRNFGWSLLIDVHGFLSRDSHFALQQDVVLGTEDGFTMPLDHNEKISRRIVEMFFSKKGWKVYPSIDHKEDIFNGGYIVNSHSKINEGIFAIQIEISSIIRKDDEKRRRFAIDLAEFIRSIL